MKEFGLEDLYLSVERYVDGVHGSWSFSEELGRITW